MVEATKPIPVTAATDWPQVLADAASAPVRLEHAGVVYRLSREDEGVWAGYDPELLRDGLRRSAGMITPEDAERMKALVYRGREEGTRPLDRP
jgi:hypothetical protein